MGVTDLLSGWLAAGEVVIVDGGMGTQPPAPQHATPPGNLTR
jgi:hypothetical protein